MGRPVTELIGSRVPKEYVRVSVSHSVVSNSFLPKEYSLSMRILQARILEWVAMPSSSGLFQPRDQTQVSSLQADS